MTNTKLLQGNCLDQLEKLGDNQVEAVVTDPPYGLSNPPDVKEVMESWLNEDEYDPDSSGFMGQDWDGFVPSPVYFDEIKRVMKPGAHALVFAGTRTVDWMGMSLRWAGFKIRDCLMWIYGSGFPKSHNISKAIDKKKGAEREVEKVTIPATDEAKKWDGYGTALKPSWEPIILARAPLSEDTIAENVLKHGTGALNIDGCRIGKDIDTSGKGGEGSKGIYDKGYEKKEDGRMRGSKAGGRFPANTVLSHTRWCVKRGSKKVDGHKQGHRGTSNNPNTYSRPERNDKGEVHDYVDEDGKETVEDWDCPPSCAVRQLDEQSGESVSRSGRTGSAGFGANDNVYGDNGGEISNDRGFNDSGGASRFFYTSKASKKDRTLDGQVENPHPTVKPVDLIECLTKLITPPGGIVLDPYAGSATGGIAVDRLNGQGHDFKWVGIEQSEEYYEIAQERLEVSSNRDWERYFDLQDWQEFDGVGPKTAEDLLDELGKASEADFDKFESVSGVGPKTAKAIRGEQNNDE